ncbi:MAG: adenylate/guanylate cyclase domain-containing protein [Candidatus Limnocylindrales bacterium]
MICAACGTENRAGRKFCSECAAPLSITCPSCGSANQPSEKFCGECGTSLGVGGAGEPAVAIVSRVRSVAQQPVAERRLVTVLFADLVGFTPFAEERDAEDVRDTLSRYFELCSAVIGRYGGTVEKFIGDAVMAVWGAPIAHEDDAERAVRAALDLVDAVTGLGPAIQARAGVLTGEAAITIGATNQGMVAGDLVNTAARLQSVAPPGIVLVGEGTMRAASQAIQFDQAGAQSLKGKESPVPAWRAMRVVAERGGRNRTEMLEAPFVGRADELRLLKELLHATGREKRTRLVSVMGPGGIGKSRLAWELQKYIDGLVETIYWHNGRSPAYGEGITFWALGEMVRGRCLLAESDDPETTAGKVSETVATLVSDEEQRRWIERALLTLLGIETGMPPDQLFAAWRAFFEAIAERGTVVLVFEDLHHADGGTLDFIDHVIEWSRSSPLYVVTLARPDLLETRPDWGAGKRSFTSIFIEPLAEEQMRELIAGLAPGLPGAAVNAIVARADGIPLYAIEIVRMLLAEGRLTEQSGQYVPVGDLSSLSVPETLTALISSRLDSLDPTDRSLIHDAAVLGLSFTTAALSALSGIGEAELQDRLRGVIKRELIKRDVDPRSPERGQFVFVQALIREVAYNTLSRKDRKSRHMAAARYFEASGSDELASALASHYLAAHQNAPEGAEADALAAQARIALRSAADRAIALAAYDQAMRFMDQALAVTTDPGELAELHEKAGSAAVRAARYETAEAHLRDAIELHAQSADRRPAARASAALGLVLVEARRNQQALEFLEGAVAEFGELGEDSTLLDSKAHLVRALVQLEQHERAIEVVDQVLPIAEHADLLELTTRLLLSKTIALANLGRMREASALIKGVIELARDNGLDNTLAAALTVASAQLGEVDARVAFESAREAHELSLRLGRRDRLVIAANNLGYTGFLAGDWDTAAAVLEAALAEDLDLANRVWLTSNLLIVRSARGGDVSDALTQVDAWVAEGAEAELALASLDAHANAALAAGRLTSAASAWRQIARESGSAGPWGYYQAARCALWARDVEALRTDLAAFDATGIHGRVVEIRRTTMRAGLAALEGRLSDALRFFQAAIGGWHDVGMTWDEALTGLDVATVLDAKDLNVRVIVASTREILERLGAQPYLARLDGLIAGVGVRHHEPDIAASREGQVTVETVQ